MMADTEFVFDGVFGFLSSPMWLVPVMHFIDNQSVVFNEAEENLHEWKQLHKQYGELVESLLSSYLQDVGITEEQFMQACKTPGLENRPQLQPIFEQLWASEDYEIFKRMMIQKNVELELQALELVRKRQGKKSKKDHKKKSRTIKTEDELLAQVMKQSELEYQQHQKRLQENETEAKGEAQFDDAMEKMLSESTNHFEKLEQEVLKKEKETQQYVEESIKQSLPTQTKENIDDSTDNAKPSSPKAKAASPKPQSPPPSDLVKSKSPEIAAPVKSKKTLAPIRASTGSQAASDWMKSAREENKSETASSNETQAASASEDDMLKRIEYLKQQRDRLLSLKKAEREKQLDNYSKTESSKKRPTSARVARQAVSGGGGDTKPAASAEDAKKFAMRKALAEKLKKEVINK